MACYVEEEEVWKCPKHPSKRRRNGICPTCLRDRLGSLCPNCAKVRPCACVTNTASSSSSSSSSFSFFNGGDVTRVSNFTESEPSFRRSRSVAIPFLRSASRRVKTPSFLSALKRSTTKKTKENEGFNNFSKDLNNDENIYSNNRIEDFARMITRSRSVSAGTTAMASGFRRSDVISSPAKWKLWHFPSPMKVFRSSKTPKVIVQDRSPLHRG